MVAVKLLQSRDQEDLQNKTLASDLAAGLAFHIGSQLSMKLQQVKAEDDPS